ncbi:hypothetical protein RBG61_06970 [Paludicola sp. MB14-C6]|uniref:hypothetical protein n=1 Tax=Paludihabitans sp. MB14-C6 TaxID=3070656 RepID=UPI0027DD1052|nr:hypothetical protein [Paludicola sp. MB14-C6]WMJ24403.1 hypothetical protein RBG61_06970 [Paludicola sp. MB14-C6]
MDDLLANLQNILSTPEGQAQLQNVAKMLNINGNQQSSSTQNTQTNQNSATTQNNGNSGGGFDLSGIMNMLNNNSNQNNAQQQNNENSGNNSGFDLSKIMSMLNQNSNNSSNEAASNSNNSGNGGFDLSALTKMLSGNNNQNNNESGMPNIDMNMILKLQKVFSSMNVNDKNSQLLLALKPHFSERRKQKVDQAISLMRLMSMLPALKESGIFAGL